MQTPSRTEEEKFTEKNPLQLLVGKVVFLDLTSSYKNSNKCLQYLRSINAVRINDL